MPVPVGGASGNGLESTLETRSKPFWKHIIGAKTTQVPFTPYAAHPPIAPPIPPQVPEGEWALVGKYIDLKNQLDQVQPSWNSIIPPPIYWSHANIKSQPSTSCTLNPYLSRIPLGVPPLRWSISDGLFGVVDAHRDDAFPLMDEMMQPATCPLVSKLVIQGLADNVITLDFPIIIRNTQGVTCRDVFLGIYQHFQVAVTDEERSALRRRNQQEAETNYNQRSAKRGQDRWMKRIDLVFSKLYFRGFESYPSTGGYLMYLGVAD
ncbi:hypothetical protein BDN72DRAFT_894592 [Pluteus cervinus]|uniref:Uncharacterized protein n=1 Tax=Pluteus cervinus TaxID=181527 RepID=A0ACD3B3D6_9AGAR|nr:hypothetical protein BDN72DRAFT_894592 [Pluteus cervinus]